MARKFTAGKLTDGAKTHWGMSMAMAVAMAAALGGTTARASTDGVWNYTFSGSWSQGLNWNNGAVADGAGSTATINVNINSTTIVTIDGSVASRTLGTLNIGDTDSSNVWLLGTSGGGTLTFDSGTVGTAAQLNQVAGSRGDTITVPLILNSSLAINNQAAATNAFSTPLTINGGITGGGNAITFHGAGNYYGGIAGLTINTAAITNVSAIRNLYGTVDTASGAPFDVSIASASPINNGSLNLELSSYGDGGLNVASVITTTGGLTVNGPGSLGAMTPIASNSTAVVGMVDLSGANAITGATTVNAGYLYLDYKTNNNTKIDAASSLTLNSGYLAMNSVSSGTSIQTINGLVVGGGANEVKLLNNATSITLDTRGAAATSMITRNGSATVDFNNANATTAIVLAANSNVNGILPAWVTFAGTDWATVNASHQIVVYAGYTATALPTSGSVGTTDTLNYKTNTGTTLVGALPVYSINLTGGLTENLATFNLTLNSGGLLTNTSSAITFNGTGALVAGNGTGELVVQTNNNSGLLTINTPVTAGTVTKSGAGQVLFTNATFPAGQITINQGTLSLGNAIAANLSSLGNIALNSGGALGMNGTFSRSIDNTATPASGTVAFGAGGGGFSAVGGPLTVNLGGAGATLNASSVNNLLVLNNVAANYPITLVNPINIDTAGITLSVGNSGSVSGQSSSTVAQGNNGYAYAKVGAISGNGDLRVQGTATGGNNSAPAGLLVPMGSLTYTGSTIVTGTALYTAPNASNLPATTAIELGNAGVLATSGTFNRSIGHGAGQVVLGSYAGFAAMGGPLTVMLNNSTAEPNPGRFNENLTLGSPFAGNSVNYQNNVTNSFSIASAGPVLNTLSGTISGTNGISEAGGGGELYIPNVNTFTGNFSLGKADGFLRIGAGNTNIGGNIYSSLGLAGAPVATGSSIYTVSNGGTGYTTGTQTLTISAPDNPGGVQAVGTATVSAGGVITAVSITTSGSGYYKAPTLSLAGGTGAVIVPSNAATWFNSNTDYGTLDLNGTTTSEPIGFGNSYFGNLAQIINSNTTAATFNGDLSWFNNGNQPFGGPGDIVFNGNIYGNQAANNQFKQGAGKLSITGTNFEGGAGTSGLNLSFPLWGGTVLLDYTTNNTNKLGVTGTGQLILSNVSLQVNGNATAATVQSVSGGTKLNEPGNVISVTAPGTANATLALGAIARANGGTADFQLANPSTGVAALTTTTNNISGILTPTITAGGTGYTTAPSVTFNVPTSGSAASGVAVVSGGAVVGIIITNPGSGYSSASLPTVTFGTVAGASGATANGNFGSYGYLGGWATFGGGSSFATGATGGVATNIGALPTASYGSQVAAGKLLDVGTGNAAATPFTDATGATYAAAGLTNAVVAGIRFNDPTGNAGAPNTLKIAASQNIWIGDNNNGNLAGGIIDTANSGANGPSVISGGEISFGVNGSFFVSQANTNQPLRIDSQINTFSSGATFIKTGLGELQLTNTVNAGVNVFGGKVTANNANAMGTGIGLGNASTFQYGAIAAATPTGGSATSWGNKVTLFGPATFDNEGGSLSFTNTGNDFSANGSVPWDLTITGTGDIALAGGISLGATYGSVNNTTLTTISPGFGQLIKTGSNNLTIAGTSLISGGVVINNGTVTLANASDTLPNNEPISINTSTAHLAIINANFDAVGPITLNAGFIDGTGTLQAMAYNFNAGSVSANLAGIVGIYKATGGTVTLSGSNTFTGATMITAGTLAVGTDAALGAASSTVTISSGATLDITSAFATSRTVTLGAGSPAPTIQVDSGIQSLAWNGASNLVKSGNGQLNLTSLPAALTITAGNLKLASATNHTLTTLTSLNITPGGTLDLTNHDLYINGAAGYLSVLSGKVITSTVGPTTNGPTTLELAVLNGTDYNAVRPSGTLDGTVVGGGDLVGVLAYAGDANLDGKVTADDYLAINLGLVFNLSGWIHGDFDQDGTIGANDLALIDKNYQDQFGSVADSEIALHTQWFGAAYTDAFNALSAPAAVPEPASMALLGLGALSLLRRKK